MSTPPKRAGNATSTEGHGAKGRRWIGLALLLGGVGLVFGGLALPWVTYTCTATCIPGALSGDFVPAANGGFFPLLPYSLPYWLVLAAVAVVMLGQDRLPADQRSTGPALLLAGLLLTGINAPLPVLLSSGPYHTWGPVVERALDPGFFVSLLGGLLVGVGGWLHYLPEFSRFSPLPALPRVPADG
jgi:hypothetical protein